VYIFLTNIILNFFICLFLAFYYRKLTLKNGPLAEVNSRSLHKKPISIGGGLAIFISMVFALSCLYIEGNINSVQLSFYLIGGFTNTIVGFIDDRLKLSPKYHLGVQIFSSIYIFYNINLFSWINKFNIILALKIIFLLTILFTVLWLFNSYNFIDGTDGMALSATIFIGLVMAIIFFLKNDFDLSLILISLISSSLAFLLFNKPPAKMFLGDTGIKFIAFIIISVFLESCLRDINYFYNWAILVCLYVSDTSLTTFIRFLTIKNFWAGHRSHAYQNLARIWRSHTKILQLFMAINLIWSLPLTLIVFIKPNFSLPIMICAYLPTLLFSYKFGPKFASI
tara:strand:- start:203 stop:1219 length:1017 start_codon:yes stop_codon:yes gene_type:complete